MLLGAGARSALQGKQAALLGPACASLGEKDGAAAPSSAVAKRPKPTDIDRTIEVLVMPGRQSNENLSGFQLNALKGVIGKDANLSFQEAQAEWVYKDKHDLHDADDMSRTLSKGKKFGTWFHISSDDPRPRPYMWKFFDPTVKISYSDDAEKEVQRFIDKVSDGSVDVVLALFEGSIVVHMAVAKLLEQGKEIPWRCSVFFGSMPIRDDKYLRALATKQADHPALMVFGKTDQDYFYCRSEQSGRKPSEDYYKNTVVLEHLQGHMLPNAPPRSADIYNHILAEIKYQCGQGPPPVSPSSPPRPTSFPLLDLNMMAPKKLKVLSLCGGHACEALSKMQVGNFRNALGPNAEWHFLAGGKEWTYYDGEPIPSDSEKMIAGKNPLMNWYLDKAHEGPGRLNRDKQFDPSIKVEYHDVQEQIDRLAKYIDENGPFDVVIAFSQGCIMLHMLIGHLRKRKLPDRDHNREDNKICSAEEMPWRVSCFFAGMHVRDPNWVHLVDTPKKSTHPAIFVSGKADEYYDYAKDGFGFKPQEEYYENPLVLDHDQSHEFPSAQPRAGQIYQKVCDRIWHHCGGVLEKPVAAAPQSTSGGKFDLKSLIGPPAR